MPVRFCCLKKDLLKLTMEADGIKILHLDLPRGLSFNLKEFNTDNYRLLSGDEKDGYCQADLNFDFWRYSLSDDSSRLFDVLFNIHSRQGNDHLKLIRACLDVLAKKLVGRSFSLDLDGFHFPEDIKNSSENLFAYITTGPDSSFFNDYFRTLDKKFNVSSGYKIISLGADSHDGLVAASFLSAYIRQNNPTAHITLSGHHYENFTLLNNIDSLMKKKIFFSLFHSIILYREEIALGLMGLKSYLMSGDVSCLSNIALRLPDGIQLFPPNRRKKGCKTALPIEECFDDSYLSRCAVPSGDSVYLTTLCRNMCSHHQCTFCVQSGKFIMPDYFDIDDEVQGCLTTIDYLVKHHGIKNFSFLDQEARPKILEQFSRALLERGLEINWYVRMVVDPGIDEQLFKLMGQAGCREILFGLETVSRSTAKKMNKFSAGISPKQCFQLLEKIQKQGIDVILNFIYAFPGESDETFGKTWNFFLACIEKFTNINFIFNKFSLFINTEIYRDPFSYGIKKIFLNTGDLQVSADYIDRYGRRGHDHSYSSKYLYAGLGRDITAVNDNALSYPEAVLKAAAHLNNSSIGAVYRLKRKRYLSDVFFEGISSRAMTSTKKTVIVPTFISAGTTGSTTLIIGSNSYLGQNIALAGNHRNLLLTSASYPNKICRSLTVPFIKENIETSIAGLISAYPSTIFIVARPLSQDYKTNLHFYNNLKELLNHYAKRRHLKKIIFMSTQLVYPTPKGPEPVFSDGELYPMEIYEYFKIDMEFFIKLLCARGNIIAEIFRLPLLFGGEIIEAQRNMQLIYKWIDSYGKGQQWDFRTDEDKQFGNSWLLIDDFVRYLFSKRATAGCRIANISSGDFTYHDLHGFLRKENGLGKNIIVSKKPLYLPKSCFFLKNEVAISKRDLFDAITHIGL